VKKRLLRVLLALVVLPLILGAVGVCLLLSEPEPVSDKFLRLHAGMTESQAEAVLGPPYHRGPRGTLSWNRGGCEIELQAVEDRIVSGWCVDEDGTALLLGTQPQPRPFWERLRRRLPR
jgi:hypothetical protein